jgi:hypothetical protein
MSADRKTLRLLRPDAKPRTPFKRLRQAVRLFRGGYAPKAQRKRNMRAWLAAVDRLGEKWVYATPITKKASAK